MKERIRTLARLALAAVFVYAALPKILAPADFALALFRYRLLPDAAVNAIALTLPWLELLAALALLEPRARAAGAAWLAALLGVATAGLLAALARGLEIDCGCFSLRPGASPITLASVARNVALLALALWCAGPARAQAGGDAVADGRTA